MKSKYFLKKGAKNMDISNPKFNSHNPVVVIDIQNDFVSSAFGIKYIQAPIPDTVIRDFFKKNLLHYEHSTGELSDHLGRTYYERSMQT